VFCDVLPCKMIVDKDNHFTRQYIPEDSSEPHTRRRENLKSHEIIIVYLDNYLHSVGKMQNYALLKRVVY
jgi:hypothetical protein